MSENRHVAAVWSFIKLSRPHFLLGGALLYGLGATFADEISVGRYLLGQAMVTAAQVTAHFVNEFADVAPDHLVTTRTFFSGGSGVLVSGELAPRVALRSAVATSVAAVVLAAVVAAFAPTAAVIGLAALAVSWAYSMPPIRLLSTGFGEMVTSLVVVLLVPLTGAAVQGGMAEAGLWWTAAVLLPVHLAMMLAFELPDLESDAAAGKRVLAVRIGATKTKRAVIGLLAAAGVTALGAGTAGLIDAAEVWAASVGLLPAVATITSMRRNRYGVLTSSAVATLVAVAGAVVLVRIL